MRRKLARLVSVLAALAFSNGFAMSAPAGQHCRVVHSEKLPMTSGGGAAICAAVGKAIATAAPNAHYTAEVRVISPSRLSALLVVEGRALPEQKFAVMDRDLNPASIQRFAQSLAAEVAKASKR